ncbi:MAG: class I SAM-dependent methyltransferase [Lentisphaeria bacterium]|nr:class I SAM-dependent methyltransferase [Lentisphaeria bacterium]
MREDYQLLDSGNLCKLEQAGPYRLVRPALNAFWNPRLPQSEWQAADAVFTRKSDGSGAWKMRSPLPPDWQVRWGGFTLKVKPTGFGHLGVFAEQSQNWDFFRTRLDASCRALNLFGYSGVGSMAMARAGAKVCHLDASQGMIDWGRENLKLNPDVPDAIRWIADDVKKFVKRELRRQNSYDLIALDPPTFGRGTKGEVWKIETDLAALLADCAQLRRPGRPFTLVLSCHSPGFSVNVLRRVTESVFGTNAGFEGFEMRIPESGGPSLPSGICLRMTLA